MEQLKQNIEKLNNIYYKLNGLYEGVVENLRKNNIYSQEVDFLVENLSPSYIGTFLQEIDDYVIDKINHGLDTDFYYFIEANSCLSDAETSELYSKVNSIIRNVTEELMEIENIVYATDSKIPSFGVCCQEMRSIADQIDESVSLLSREGCRFIIEEDKTL